MKELIKALLDDDHGVSEFGYTTLYEYVGANIIEPERTECLNLLDCANIQDDRWTFPKGA